MPPMGEVVPRYGRRARDSIGCREPMRARHGRAKIEVICLYAARRVRLIMRLPIDRAAVKCTSTTTATLKITRDAFNAVKA